MFMADSFNSYQKMRDLISAESSLIMVISRFGISLGFGDKTVGEVCREHNVDTETLLAVSDLICGKGSGAHAVSLPSLVPYLRQAHVYFLDFKLPSIRRRLLEAIDCSGTDELAFLILKFFDEYVTEVRNHMTYENNVVFEYVNSLVAGKAVGDYTISMFASKHNHMDDKLKELKDIIIRYYPQKGNDLLCEVLYDIINCEQDLKSHCLVEDELFVPAVEALETSRANVESPTQDDEALLSSREKDIVICIAKGMSSKEIADHLFISVNTVNTHRRNISSKLQIHSPSGLAIYAIVNGLVTIDQLKPVD